MRIKLALLIFLFISIQGCQQKQKYILKKEKLAEVMIDIYLLDAMYSSQMKFPIEYNKLDSGEYYGIAFKEHGITKAQFDFSVNYYTGRPADMNKIYEIVLNELSKTEAEVTQAINEERAPKKTEKKNLWFGKKNWVIPDEGKHNKVEFSIPTMGPGLYTVTAKLRLFEDDESVNPRMTAYFLNVDENGEENTLQFNPKPIKRSSDFITVSISKNLQNENFHLLKGAVLDHSNQDSSWTKHAEIQDLEILYTPE